MRSRCPICGAKKIWQYSHWTGKDTLVCPVDHDDKPETHDEPIQTKTLHLEKSNKCHVCGRELDDTGECVWCEHEGELYE